MAASVSLDFHLLDTAHNHSPDRRLKLDPRRVAPRNRYVYYRLSRFCVKHPPVGDVFLYAATIVPDVHWPLSRKRTRRNRSIDFRDNRGDRDDVHGGGKGDGYAKLAERTCVIGLRTRNTGSLGDRRVRDRCQFEGAFHSRRSTRETHRRPFRSDRYSLRIRRKRGSNNLELSTVEARTRSRQIWLVGRLRRAQRTATVSNSIRGAARLNLDARANPQPPPMTRPTNRRIRTSSSSVRLHV